MNREFIFNSTIAENISGFIEEKKSLGYKYFNESKWMEKFDRYWSCHGYGNTGLTFDNLSGWLEKRDCEGEKCLATRISVIRQFSLYLNGLGIPSYVPPIDVRYSKPVIHLIRPDEMAALFHEIEILTFHFSLFFLLNLLLFSALFLACFRSITCTNAGPPGHLIFIDIPKMRDKSGQASL